MRVAFAFQDCLPNISLIFDRIYSIIHVFMELERYVTVTYMRLNNFLYDILDGYMRPETWHPIANLPPKP